MNNTYDYQVLNLTEDFYLHYPSPPFTELVSKEQRPYNCLLIQSHYDYFICIPYRSSITHRYAFKFRKSERSKKTKSGLDYTKTVIIKDSTFISDKDAIVDSDEYSETRQHIDRIVSDATGYVDEYVKYVKGEATDLSEQEFKRKYDFSTLQYFHNELGIPEETHVEEENSALNSVSTNEGSTSIKTSTP